ncbi:hypothetical protein OH77DRAFT_244741 [Trametes cingulata]|nr:hypothetical protein OH77DRAFT_244741 [Trametes cingulata]
MRWTGCLSCMRSLSLFSGELKTVLYVVQTPERSRSIADGRQATRDGAPHPKPQTQSHRPLTYILTPFDCTGRVARPSRRSPSVTIAATGLLHAVSCATWHHSIYSG